MQELGQRIREAREEKGLSQADLAMKVEVNRATILHYERGQVNQPLLEIVTRIATALRTNFEVRGCTVGNERVPLKGTVPEQFCLPFDQEHIFDKALVKFLPRRGRLIITAEISA
jgi:transcriptional regulator with XRE-family HTH domain